MKKTGDLRRLLGYLGSRKRLLIWLALASLCGNICLLLAPRLVGQAIDLIVAGTDYRAALLPLLLVIAALCVAGALLTRLSAQLANIVANKTVAAIRTDAFEKLGRLPVSYFDTHSRGDLISRFSSDIDAISDGLNQGIVSLISGFITVVLCLAFMLILDVRVALVAVFVTPLCFLVGFFITRYGHRRFAEQAQVLGELNGCAEEMLTGQRTVRAFSYEQQTEQTFREINQRLYRSGYRAQFASALVNPSTRFVNNIAYVLVGVGGLLAGLSVGYISSFLTYTAQYAKPFNEITSITMQLQSALASARRIFELLDAPELSSEEGLPALAAKQDRIDFEHVRFSYTPDRPLITDLELSVSPGMTVAIVGPTGAGKTTLVNLLMRFYDVQSGCIRIDGQDITTVTRDSLRRSFGMVLQDTWLFEGTVRDNIAYGKADASDEEVIAAAKAAHAHSFIRRLPQGYQTVIAEDGGNLSAGQKQLLTIARTMLTGAPMLILDEATSSVDMVTEKKIQQAFAALMKGKTTFIIAHRLSTIRDADRILVLDNGNIVEIGTHQELLARQGFYYRLYQSQFAAV